MNKIFKFYPQGSLKAHLRSELLCHKENNEYARVRSVYYAITSDEKTYSCFEMRIDGKLIGLVLFYITKNKIATLYDIFVFTEYQGKGYGKELFNNFYRLLFEQKVLFLKFYSDPQSIEFYVSLGFKFFGFSKSEQIPWSIVFINSYLCIGDNESFHKSLENKDCPYLYLFEKELKKLKEKEPKVITKKKVLDKIELINYNFINYTIDTPRIELDE